MPTRRSNNALYWTRLRHAEEQMMQEAFAKCGTVTAAATYLGISTNYLSERSRELGVKRVIDSPGPFRPGPALTVGMGAIVDSLVEMLQFLATPAEVRLIDDCRAVLGLLDRGVATPEDAAIMLSRIWKARRSPAPHRVKTPVSASAPGAVIRGWHAAAAIAKLPTTTLRRFVERGVLAAQRNAEGSYEFQRADLEALRDGPRPRLARSRARTT